MPISTWESKYYEAVRGYFESPEERFLLDAADIGRGLVQEDIPPEDIAEMHEKALKRFAEESPKMMRATPNHLISAPLMELMVAYGLAFRERLAARRRTEEELQQRNQELGVLFRIVNELTGPGEFIDKANSVVERIARGVDAQGVTLRRFNPESNDLDLVAGSGTYLKRAVPIISLWETLDLAREVFESGEMLVVNDYASHPQATQDTIDLGIKSLVLLPISALEPGLLVVVSQTINHFTHQRIEFLRAIGDELGVLLENAELNDQLTSELERRRVTEAQLLQRSGELEALLNFASILGEPGTYEDKLKDVMQDLARVAGAEWATLRVPDQQSTEMRVLARVGNLVDSLVDAPTSQTVSDAWNTGEPVVMNDYMSHPHAVPIAIEAGAKSMIALPIKGTEGALGVAVVASHETGHFTPERVRLLTAISDGLGSLLENARLYREITLKEELEERRNTFVSVASHEIRTPMAVIAGYSELLLNRDLSESVKRESLERIHRSSQSLAAIVDDMLNVSRIHSGKLAINLEPVAVSDLVANVIASLGPIYPRNALVMEIGGKVPDVLVDNDKLNQILINLVDNALKYSPDGGQVRVSARHKPENRLVVIAVSDEGMGIAQEDQEQLFEVFHRIRRPETTDIRGSGLGLYIVKEMLQILHGKIWLESKLGKGSTFYISLPTSTAEKTPKT